MGTGTKGHRRPETALRGPALHNHLSSVPELAHTCRDPANWHAAPLRLRRISFPLSNQARNPSNRWTVNARIVKMRIAAHGAIGLRRSLHAGYEGSVSQFFASAALRRSVALLGEFRT